jgi:ABC-type dipeptide/oligopeptide/nickel transport system ATPase component
MHDKIKAIHKRSDEILDQVKLTNGRVSNLEEWKAQLSGGAKVIIIISTLFAFMVKMGWIIIK